MAARAPSRDEFERIYRDNAGQVLGPLVRMLRDVDAAEDALQGIDTATTIRVRNGRPVSTDGPFAETKEVLGGFYMVDCKDLDRASELAGEIPDAGLGTGSVEVRPIRDLSDMPGMS